MDRGCRTRTIRQIHRRIHTGNGLFLLARRSKSRERRNLPLVVLVSSYKPLSPEERKEWISRLSQKGWIGRSLWSGPSLDSKVRQEPEELPTVGITEKAKRIFGSG